MLPIPVFTPFQIHYFDTTCTHVNLIFDITMPYLLLVSTTLRHTNSLNYSSTQGPNRRWIGLPSVGVNHFDSEHGENSDVTTRAAFSPGYLYLCGR